MATLLRFAIKQTRMDKDSSVEKIPVRRQDPDVSSALNVLASTPSFEGMPADIDKVPCALDYPTTSAKGTVWNEYDSLLVSQLLEAPWKSLAIRSTTISPFSASKNFSVSDEGAGWRGIPRIRCVAVEWPDPVSGEVQAAEWDMDTLNIEQRARLLAATMTNVLFGNNTPEIMNWVRQVYKRITGDDCPTPQRAVDLAMVARVMRPSIPMELQVKADSDSDVKNIVSRGGSGWSFEGITAIATGEASSLDELASPRLWCAPAPLEPEYHEAIKARTLTLRRILLKLMGASSNTDLLDAWDSYATSLTKDEISRLHVMQHFPLVLNHMHMNGLPFSQSCHGRLKLQIQDSLQQSVTEILRHAPVLKEFEADFLEVSKGYSDQLKFAIGKVFEELGLKLEYTKGHIKLPKIGEKDLRGAGATQDSNTAPLFEALVSLSKLKRQHEMAVNLSDFAKASPDGRLHSIFSAAAGTLRLTSIEPSTQQMPSTQMFRDQVEAPDGYKVVACDFSALDVRVGAALAIRAQRLWVKALKTGNLELITKDKEMLKALDIALRDSNPKAEQIVLERNLENIRNKAKETRRWQDYDLARKKLTAYRAAAAWLKIVPKAKQSKDGCWGGLREAFELNAEVHTYTTLRLMNVDPVKLIGTTLGDNPGKELRKEWWAAESVRIGPARKRGKISNLSLMYGMTLEGFMDDAAKKFDEHWSIEEASEIFEGWFDAFPEIDLMQCITEMQAITHSSQGGRLIGYRLKDEKKGLRRPLNIYRCSTLSGRTLYAEGLNAGLNYGNQGTGADVLMDGMVTLRLHFREVHDTIVNQVHDELVGVVRNDLVDDYKETYEAVLLDQANKLTKPYGIPMEIHSTVGDVWIKD